jgi:hypothetical protein
LLRFFQPFLPIAMADSMADLEAELRKEREAQDKRRASLQAQQEALNDLARMPAKTEQRQEPAKADGSSMPASSSSTSPADARDTDKPKNPGVYIPPSWHTAGQEPDVAAPPPRGEPDLIESESVSLPGCGCGGQGPGFGEQMFAMAGMHPPSEASFEAFFKGWFERDHFPQLSEDVKRELVHRAKSKGFFSGLSSQVKKWAMANTDVRLQTDAWCNYFLQNAPPKYRVFGCMRVASINLGSQAVPCWLMFYGFPDKENGATWFLPPFTHGTADVVALLDELDGRGGMAALVQAVAS